jgi:3-methyladenine DNA glycosylase AlkD
MIEQPIERLIEKLRAHANPANVAGMARYGISTVGTLGVPVYILRRMAKEAGRDHTLADALWNSGIHEARIIATLVDDPALVTARQMDRWARDFDSWDVCDHACHNLFRYSPLAFAKAAQWAGAKREFVRRAGFSMMAGLAVKAKSATDEQFTAFLPVIAQAASDDRNMVKKSVNWALRQIGKRNRRLHKLAIAAAEEIRRQDSRSARWIAADALRELRSPATIGRIKDQK